MRPCAGFPSLHPISRERLPASLRRILRNTVITSSIPSGRRSGQTAAEGQIRDTTFPSCRSGAAVPSRNGPPELSDARSFVLTWRRIYTRAPLSPAEGLES